MADSGKQSLIQLGIEAGRRRCKVTGNTAKVWKAKYPVLPPAFEPKQKKKVEANPQSLGI
jgi:hypothetical protein